MKNMPIAGIESAQAAINLIVSQASEPSASARIGIAMHRLLELYRSDTDITALLPAVARSQGLSETESSQALKIAQTIVQGEAAWLWDANQIDWQANEAELMHAGQLLRLDRLVKHTATQAWWVIDYKSNPAPQRVPELKTQLQQYQAAVKAANLQSTVKAAFITAQGALIEI